LNKQTAPRLDLLWVLGGTILSIILYGCSASYHKAKADQEVYCLIHSQAPRFDSMPRNFTIEGVNEPLPVFQVFEATRTYTLREAILTANQFSRSYRFREEDLFSQGLSLSSAQHQFRPQYFGFGGADINRDEFSTDLSGFLSLGMNRMLETGTDISVDLTTNLFRIISGDDPQKILASALTASIRHPILRGSGQHIVRENLTQEERDFVYNIRDFVRFRKEFTVSVAQRYFNLLGQLDQIENEYNNYVRRETLVEQTVALVRAGQRPPYEIDQAQQEVLSARNRWIGAIRNFEDSIDDFKFSMGVPVEGRIFPATEELIALREKGLEPVSVSQEAAIAFALDNRLDFKNIEGRYEDARRKVVVAEDALKPLFDLLLSYQAESDGRTETFDFADGDKEYGLGVDFELPLDVKIERNVFRQSLINLVQARRNVVDFEEVIRQDIRSLMRNLEETEESYRINLQSLRLAENRVSRERVLFDAGQVAVRDVLEAQDALLSAQNAVTSDLIDHFNLKLELYLATESLRLLDNGLWLEQRA
jgi:outer membrane protein TolC